MNAIGALRGVVKHYDWGGRQFIAGLLSQTNSEEKPFAEYWMGTHPQGMSVVAGDSLAQIPTGLLFLRDVPEWRAYYLRQVP